MNACKKASLLSAALVATPFMLGGADSGPQLTSETPAAVKQSNRAQPATIMSTNSEATFFIGKSERLAKLEVSASKTDAHQLELRLNFASGTKLTIDLRRCQDDLVSAEMSTQGGEDTSLQLTCKSLEFELAGRDAQKPQQSGKPNPR